MKLRVWYKDVDGRSRFKDIEGENIKWQVTDNGNLIIRTELRNMAEFTDGSWRLVEEVFEYAAENSTVEER